MDNFLIITIHPDIADTIEHDPDRLNGAIIHGEVLKYEPRLEMLKDWGLLVPIINGDYRLRIGTLRNTWYSEGKIYIVLEE